MVVIKRSIFAALEAARMVGPVRLSNLRLKKFRSMSRLEKRRFHKAKNDSWLLDRRAKSKLENPSWVGGPFKAVIPDRKLFLIFARMYHKSLFLCSRRILIS